ncbi:MAG: PaaI family thioesterase [Lachnospiraceae bacterium]|jgi:uncharacterized protein (TIGR00369 family)|nr:PaaI family thioesterase [Lachnospiraceae bacterium]MCI9399312.1 PaaI family thioesterase [Lachnospiraceae bacterium]MCX4376444.1 PaaI family thioesterase [Lachnospiraceae bacterium]
MEQYRAMLEQMNQMPAFIPWLGITVLEMKAGYCKGEMLVRSELNNPLGMVHGGVIFSLADTVGGLAVIAHDCHENLVTLSSNINYLRPAIHTPKLIAEARAVKHGSKVAVYTVDIMDAEGVLIASTTTSYFMRS